MSMESSSSCFYLSNDLLIEILLRMPVKTLLRFKSVCISWFLLIQNSDFIKRHTELSSKSSSSKLGNFIFQYMQSTLLSNHRGIEHNSWNIFSISGDDDEVVVKDLVFPPSYGEQKKLILIKGSCKGIVCLYNNVLKDVFLWNPYIHQFRLLPKSSFTFPVPVTRIWSEDFVAFGFDVETKDYKVLRVTFDPFYRVQVYNLSTDSWRTLVDVVLPVRPRDINNGGYLNGSYYLIAYKMIDNPSGNYYDNPTGGDYNKIRVMEVLSFDFTKEIFNTMSLPDEITDSNDSFNLIQYGSIIFLGEKIATTFHYTLDNIFEVWVLNEISVKESWTKLYRIGPYGTGFRPIGISNNGEFIFVVTLHGIKLWLLNPSTQVMKEIQWDNNQRADDNGSSLNEIFTAYVYRRSLVPVCSTRNGSTSKLSLKFDTLSVGKAVLDRHKHFINLCTLYLVRFLSLGTK